MKIKKQCIVCGETFDTLSEARPHFYEHMAYDLIEDVRGDATTLNLVKRIDSVIEYASDDEIRRTIKYLEDQYER